MAIYNIFLDFLNRDSREIYGMFANFSREKHIRLLSEAINVSAFLCFEHCLVPPGFLAECDIAREAIMRRAAFLEERLLRLPLRETTLDEFFDKKHREYAVDSGRYSGLFDSKSAAFLRRHADAMVPRVANIGSEIVTAWMEGPDASGIWDKLVQGAPANLIEQIRTIPGTLYEEGLALTWSAISMRANALKGADVARFRHALQHHYFAIYLREFNLRILTGLPFVRTSFGLAGQDLRYDYEALRAALLSVNLWRPIVDASARALLQLRDQQGYFIFRSAFDVVSAAARSPREVAEVFAIAAGGMRPIQESSETDFAHLNDRRMPPKGWNLSREQVQAIAFQLGVVGLKAVQISEERSRRLSGGRGIVLALRSGENLRVATATEERAMADLAIFVALQMEREILTKRWALTKPYEEWVWRGQRSGREILVFGPDEMGRVPAAVETMRFLSRFEVDLLIVAGIAGGFLREEVQLGDVVVAKSIADLASRKMREGEGEKFIPEFRPKEFETDPRVADFLKSSDFGHFEWERTVIDEGEWPDGRRPTLRYGAMASLDEVVSSEAWTERLSLAWPKLLGVEMEAGGVCAAARLFGKRVAVIRGISDHADPAKSDTAWRRRSMKAVATLIDMILDGGVIFGKK